MSGAPWEIVTPRTEDGTPVLADSEVIEHTENDTKLLFGRDEDVDSASTGVLYITTEHVVWYSDEDPEKGYTWSYPMISMHAVSREGSSFPAPCIFCLLSRETRDDAFAIGDEDDEVPIDEVRFVPADPDSLDLIFDKMSSCSELHPDFDDDEDGGDFGPMYTAGGGGGGGMFGLSPAQFANGDEEGVVVEGGEEEDGAGYTVLDNGVRLYTTPDEIASLTANNPDAQATLDYYNSIIQVDPAMVEQFEDADGDEDDLDGKAD